MTENDIKIREYCVDKRVKKLGFRLYHYTSLGALEGIFSNQELWLCSTASMNDKTECKVLSMDMEKGLREDLKDDANALNRCVDFFSRMNKRLSDEYPCAICLSKLEDNAAMWERYADSAEGVCIVFNTYQMVKTFWFSDSVITNVYYGFDVKNHEHYRILLDYFTGGRLEQYSFEDEKGLMDNIILCGYAFKDKSFSTEEEVRLTNLWANILHKSKIKHKLIGKQIKKVMVLDLDALCKEAETDFSDMFEEIVIGPRSKQSIDDLKSFFSSLGYDKLAEKVSVSKCPLR